MKTYKLDKLNATVHGDEITFDESQLEAAEVKREFGPKGGEDCLLLHEGDAENITYRHKSYSHVLCDIYPTRESAEAEQRLRDARAKLAWAAHELGIETGWIQGTTQSSPYLATGDDIFQAWVTSVRSGEPFYTNSRDDFDRLVEACPDAIITILKGGRK